MRARVLWERGHGKFEHRIEFSDPKKHYFNIYHAIFMHFREFHGRARSRACFQSTRRINLSSDLSSQIQTTYISMYNVHHAIFMDFREFHARVCFQSARRLNLRHSLLIIKNNV